MATLKSKEIRKMNLSERETRIEELKMELLKSKTGNSKAKEIRKIIARIKTITNESNKK